MAKFRNYYDGHFVDSRRQEWLDVTSPLDGNLLSQGADVDGRRTRRGCRISEGRVRRLEQDDDQRAGAGFLSIIAICWKSIPTNLTALISEENGKTWDEAKAEVEKSIELTEFACSMPQLVSGEILEVSKGVECRTEHFPLGVVASIVPFNFPLMVPNWTMPNALVLGNTMIMKPSRARAAFCRAHGRAAEGSRPA